MYRRLLLAVGIFFKLHRMLHCCYLKMKECKSYLPCGKCFPNHYIRLEDIAKLSIPKKIKLNNFLITMTKREISPYTYISLSSKDCMSFLPLEKVRSCLLHATRIGGRLLDTTLSLNTVYRYLQTN